MRRMNPRRIYRQKLSSPAEQLTAATRHNIKTRTFLIARADNLRSVSDFFTMAAVWSADSVVFLRPCILRLRASDAGGGFLELGLLSQCTSMLTRE